MDHLNSDPEKSHKESTRHNRDDQICKIVRILKTFYLDQTSKESIEAMWRAIQISDFDLIIDDGLHTFDAGVCLFENSMY